jgi:hypothetical protein
VSTDAIRGRKPAGTAAPPRLPADVVETAVVREIRRLVRAPEIVAQAVAAVRRQTPDVDERDVVAAVDRFSEVWSALFPAEQTRIVKLLVERVTVTADGLAVDLHTDGLGAVVREILAPKPTAVPGEVDTGSPSGTAKTGIEERPVAGACRRIGRGNDGGRRAHLCSEVAERESALCTFASFRLPSDSIDTAGIYHPTSFATFR